MDWEYEQSRCIFGFREGQIRPDCCIRGCHHKATGYCVDDSKFRWHLCDVHRFSPPNPAGHFVRMIEEGQ